MTEARPWTEADDRLLQQCYLTHTREEIADRLGRSEGSVRGRCSRLGLNQKRPGITEDKIDSILQWYTERADYPIGEFNLDELSTRLGLRKSSIARVAEQMGLTQRGRHMGDEQIKEQSEIARRWIQENGHPRGMKGRHHNEKFKKQRSEYSKKYWKEVRPLDRELRAVKRNKTMISKYGAGGVTTENTYSRTKGGRRADLDNRYFRSSWEANYARYLNWLKEQGQILDWNYECQTFVFHGVTRGALTYTPDFKVFDPDGSYAWHEVKGWMDSKSKTKLKRMTKYYPEETVIIIGKDEYRAIAKWSGLIPNWESGE